ncbi:IclR family transcriptional regulator C-terminal domain-containing protein [Kitasatospora sp. NPDC058048]|uniref:IclR family transcriptional regulator domain-containing protein n=1 Tax=Kitasatospora sp. NPDC058048 TaxID=3346313 RepID=UPI0036DA3FC3
MPRQGWAQSLAAGEAGVASLAAPVRGLGDRVVAAVTLDGPVATLTRTPALRFAGALTDAAVRLSEGLVR